MAQNTKHNTNLTVNWDLISWLKSYIRYLMSGIRYLISGRFLLLIRAIILSLVIGGIFLYQGCSSQQTPSTTESAGAPASPKTEVRVQGQNAEVLIEPSVDDVISEVVTITVTEAPSGTNMAFFAMHKQGAEDVKETGPNLGIDNDGSDGWNRLLDTTQFENGVYEISGLAMSDADSNPLGAATAQVVIEN